MHMYNKKSALDELLGKEAATAGIGDSLRGVREAIKAKIQANPELAVGLAAAGGAGGMHMYNKKSALDELLGKEATDIEKIADDTTLELFNTIASDVAGDALADRAIIQDALS